MGEWDAVDLTLLGKHGHIDVRALQRALAGVLELLSAGGVGSTDEHPWVLTDVAVGSVHIGLQAVGEVTEPFLEDLGTVTAGLARLDERAGIPTGWHDRMLQTVIRIGDVAKYQGVEGIEISWPGQAPLRMDGRLQTHARESVSARRTSLGSVRGRLHKYSNSGGRRYVGVQDDVTGESVTVDFPERLQRQIVQAIEHEVLAWGVVHWNSQGQRLHLQMEDFEVLEAADHGLATKDMAGFLGPEWTDGVDPVTWVQEQRRGD